MNNEFTSCNDCDYYVTCDEDNYPCNQCSHNYSNRFSKTKNWQKE